LHKGGLEEEAWKSGGMPQKLTIFDKFNKLPDSIPIYSGVKFPQKFS